MKMTVTKIVLAVLMLVASGWSAAQQVTTMRGAAVPDADRAPQDLQYLGKRPGGQALIRRTFQGQPPLIPHSIANYEEITIADNPCLECHISDEFKGKKMPRVSNSHLTAVPTAANPDPALDMLRWQCNSCHVPQVGAKPLVGNNFKGYTGRR